MIFSDDYNQRDFIPSAIILLVTTVIMFKAFKGEDDVTKLYLDKLEKTFINLQNKIKDEKSFKKVVDDLHDGIIVLN